MSLGKPYVTSYCVWLSYKWLLWLHKMAFESIKAILGSYVVIWGSYLGKPYEEDIYILRGPRRSVVKVVLFAIVERSLYASEKHTQYEILCKKVSGLEFFHIYTLHL